LSLRSPKKGNGEQTPRREQDIRGAARGGSPRKGRGRRKGGGGAGGEGVGI